MESMLRFFVARANYSRCNRIFPSSLEEDPNTFIKVAMNLFHKQKIDSNAIFYISDIGIKTPKVYKAKKFACKALKGKGAQSGIRIIYAYHEEED